MTKIIDHVSELLSNGNTIHYQITESGTAYHEETSIEIVRILENARRSNTRLRLFYGDIKTGRDWMEEHDTMGTISRSTGNIKIPILIKNSRSNFGACILDNCIVRIIDLESRSELYKHQNYHIGEFEVKEIDLTAGDRHYSAGVYHNEKGKVANFKTMDQAKRWIKFIKGERHNK